MSISKELDKMHQLHDKLLHGLPDEFYETHNYFINALSEKDKGLTHETKRPFCLLPMNMYRQIIAVMGRHSDFLMENKTDDNLDSFRLCGFDIYIYFGKEIKWVLNELS